VCSCDQENIRTGIIGEEVAYHTLKTLGHTPRRAPTYNEKFDLVVGGIKVDVKTQKTDRPLTYPSANMHRVARNLNDCVDVLLWVNWAIKTDIARVVGCLPIDEFLEKAVLRKAGTMDGDYVYPEDTYDVKLGQLKTLESVFGSIVQERLMGVI
jgi:hypothetical protein